MLLQNISEDYLKLNQIVYSTKRKIESSIMHIFQAQKNEYMANTLRYYFDVTRELSKVEGILAAEEFVSKSVQGYIRTFFGLTNYFYNRYDDLLNLLAASSEKDEKDEKDEKHNYFIGKTIEQVKNSAWNVYMWFIKVEVASDMLPQVSRETWEPLPDDLKVECEDIVISSETKSMSLNDIAADVSNLDRFLNNVCLLCFSKESENKNVYLRKVETGSLTVVVSCMMDTAPIIAFIYWCIHQYQKAEKRYLDNSEKKLNLINQELDIAKKILKIDPSNKEADEIIQKCGLNVLDFLDNNPKGTINGESYDTGRETLKIEQKEEDHV